MSVEVIPNWASSRLISALNAEWPHTSWDGWHFYQDKVTCKFGSRVGYSHVPPSAQMLLRDMINMPLYLTQPGDFVDLTLYGAGLHELPAHTGKLGRHRDSERHPIQPWTRTANSIIIVQKPQAGGVLRFTDESGKVIEEMSPGVGSLIIFDGRHAFHEVTQVEGPVSRRTLSVFWWYPEQVTGRDRAEFIEAKV